MKYQKNYSIVTIYGLGEMLRRRRYEVGAWLRHLAYEVENNHEEYTKGVFRARYQKPTERILKKKK